MKCGKCNGDTAGHYTLYRDSPGGGVNSSILCCWCNIRLGYAPYKDHMCMVARRALLDDPTLDLSDDVMSKAMQEKFVQLAKEEHDRKMKEYFNNGPKISTDSSSRMWTWTASEPTGPIEYNYPFQYNYTINPAPQAQNRRIVIDEFARIGDEVRRQRVENIPPSRYPQRIMHVWDEMRLAGEAPPDEERAEGRNG